MRRFTNGRGLLAGAAACGAVSLTLVAGCEVVQDDQDGEFYIDVAPVEVRDMRITAEATGELEPVLKVEVKSKASGEILELFADSGDEVEQGAILAEVDPRDVNNAYDGAKADLDVAEARIAIAQAQLERSKRLRDEEVITQQEFEQRELETANAQAALVRAETNLELAELRRNDVKITAPMNGTILEKLVEFGQVIQSATQNVSGGTTLFMMANLDNMRVRTRVDETDVGQLAPGMAATVTVEAFSDRTFEGIIEKIEPQAVVEQNITMFPVIVLLDNRSGLLKPGMNAEVEVLIDERSGTLAVPNNAVVEPQELAPAAEVLGMDPQQVALDNSVWGSLMAEAAQKHASFETSTRMATANPAAGPGAMARENEAPGDAQAAGANGAAGEAGGASSEITMEDIRALMQSGEISRDSGMVLFGALAGSGGGGRMAGGGQMNGGQRAGGERAGGEQAGGERAGGEQAGAGQRGGGGQGGRPGGWGGFGGGRGGFGMMAAMGGSSGNAAFKPAVAFVVDAEGNLEPRAIVLGISDWDYAEVLAGLREGEELALIGPAQLQARQQARVEAMTRRMQPFGGRR